MAKLTIENCREFLLFPYPPYPHKDSQTEVDLIKNMYKAKVQGIEKVFDCDDVFDAIYVRFLRSPKVEIFKDKTRTETLTEDEFAKLKKLLSERCPRKEKCQRCFIDVDCPLLIGWEKKGDVFEHSYPLLGEYFPEEKKVVLYVNDDDCKGQHTYKGVLSTYIHELFHAYFHYVTEQKQTDYNYIREIEEAMTEFGTLVFLRYMEKEYPLEFEWNDISKWALNSIGKKQETVGDLPAYGFGLYLFENLPENEAFNWINKYAERLGYIDEEDELVKQYKQMVCPCYPTEPGKCLELLRMILFETNNKPIKPSDVKGNRRKNMKNKAIIDSIMCLLSEYKIEMKDPNSNKSNLDSLKYLISQIIRAYDIPEKNHHLSQSAHDRWNELTTYDIRKYHYKKKVICDKLKVTKEYELFIGAKKTGNVTKFTNGFEFEFRKMFHEDHVIPVSMIFDEMVAMQVVDKSSIENLLNQMHMCVILKEEDRKISRTKGRSLDFWTTIKNVYEPKCIELVKQTL